MQKALFFLHTFIPFLLFSFFHCPFVSLGSLSFCCLYLKIICFLFRYITIWLTFSTPVVQSIFNSTYMNLCTCRVIRNSYGSQWFMELHFRKCVRLLGTWSVRIGHWSWMRNVWLIMRIIYSCKVTSFVNKILFLNINGNLNVVSRY